MWVFTSEGFYSVVAWKNKPNATEVPKRLSEDVPENLLLVRARRSKDLEALRKVVPDLEVLEEGWDYPARAVVSRVEWATFLAMYVGELDYPNYKNSIKDDDLHDAASRVWGVMHDLEAPRSGRYYQTRIASVYPTTVEHKHRTKLGKTKVHTHQGGSSEHTHKKWKYDGVVVKPADAPQGSIRTRVSRDAVEPVDALLGKFDRHVEVRSLVDGPLDSKTLAKEYKLDPENVEFDSPETKAEDVLDGIDSDDWPRREDGSAKDIGELTDEEFERFL